MAENSGIEWTHNTFNPWIGCTKVSAACDHCYAEVWDNRFKGGRWGPHAARTRTKTWRNPVKWQKQAKAEGKRYRVFCASLADVFDNHKSILPAWRRELWQLIRDTPDLDWLLLTKRPQNIAKMLPEDWADGYSNVWLGTTVENQKTAEQRIPYLLDVAAKVRFLSCEPLIGPIDLTDISPNGIQTIDALRGTSREPEWQIEGLSWIITGGESGPNFRPADKEWFRDLRDQCAAAGVPFLFKQWEGKTTVEIKAKGRELDGVIHDGYPLIWGTA